MTLRGETESGVLAPFLLSPRGFARITPEVIRRPHVCKFQGQQKVHHINCSEFLFKTIKNVCTTLPDTRFARDYLKRFLLIKYDNLPWTEISLCRSDVTRQWMSCRAQYAESNVTYTWVMRTQEAGMNTTKLVQKSPSQIYAKQGGDQSHSNA